MAKIPDIKSGDLIKIYTKIKEGDKERITQFQGVVVQVSGANLSKTVTVRKISAGVGIERIFPIHSPMITKIKIEKRGKVRKARLTYLRKHKRRKIKIREAPQTASKAEEVGIEKLKEEKATTPKEQKSKKPEGQTGESAPGQEAVEKA